MKNGFSLHFLEGQKLIHDLAIIHHIQGQGFAYFRDCVLSTLPLISFLKPGESLGIYIDSENPFFRLKIETNHSGSTRMLLLPEDFNLFPLKITGETRITKLFQGGHAPYTSVVHFQDMESKQVVNEIIKTSYQANAEVYVSEVADQSLLLLKLPPINVDSQFKDETPSLESFFKKNKNMFHQIFDDHHNDVEKIVKSFEQSSFAYLSSRQVELFCPCSKERMIDNLRMMYLKDPEALFDGKPNLEAKCDYCKKTYDITRTDLEKPITSGPLN
ncbi:MAG: Hsp33 family molecular chaperone HslO [Bacteriovoracaceae bacterium]|nr:Hsp33 family molecular chaperone HslO [Bacteriovoracaceae bacterium]